MKTLITIVLTGIISNIISAVILIRVGGWLPILVAIVSLLYTMLMASICMIGIDGVVSKKKENPQSVKVELYSKGEEK